MAKKQRKHFRKTPKKKKNKFGVRLLKYMTVCLSILLILLAGFIYSVYAGLWGKIPDYQELLSLRNNEASEVYSQDGVLMGNYYIENRKNISYDHINPETINALIATEDVRFYEHQGFDRMSILRVIFKTLLLGDRSSGGGSTISQQLAKNLYPREEQQVTFMPVIKIKENIMAYRLENIYTKQEILTLYLNTVSFGERTFGIESAAQRYFSTSASELTLPQSATLIGMLKGPSRYNPRLYPERSLQRRNTVISQMVRYDFIPEETGDSLKKIPLELDYSLQNHYSGIAPYLREKVRQEALKLIEEYNQANQTSYNLYKDGLIITTTIDAQLQEYAEKAIDNHMAALQKNFYQELGKREPWDHDQEILTRAVKNSEVYKKLKNTGLPEDNITEEMNRKKSMLIYSPEGEVKTEFSSLDSIKYYLKILHPGMIAAEPKTGKIKVWVGGLDYKYFQFDQVTAPRQPGSVFKPVIYSAAILNESPLDQYYHNELRTYPEYNDWTPRNSDHTYGGYYTLKGALSKSINTIAVQVLLQTGIERVMVHAQQLGITSFLPQLPSLALGVADVPLYEMIRPYLVFAGNGWLPETYFLSEIRDKNGTIIYRHDTIPPVQVVPGEHAALMTNILADVINEGTGRRLRSVYGLQNEMAGKTGTTQNNADGWFIGYHPHLVVGVRVGANDRNVHFRSTALGQGANTALPIFGLFMQSALKNENYSYWKNLSFPVLQQEHKEVLRTPEIIDSITMPKEFKKLERKNRHSSPEKKEKKGFFRSLFKKRK